MNPEDMVNQLWESYISSNDQNAREELIVHYSPLIKFIVGRMINDFPKHVSAEDLTSNGLFGLIKAVETFEPERGYKFETYAAIKIKGSIIDELRNEDWLPRSVREKSKTINEYRAEILQKGRAEVGWEEISEHTGLSEKQIHTTEKVTQQAHPLSLHAQLFTDTGESGELLDILNPERSELHTFTDEGGSVERSLENETMKQFIKKLDEEERVIIALRYYQGYSYGMIGEILNIKENTCRRRHGRILLKLKELYENNIN